MDIDCVPVAAAAVADSTSFDNQKQSQAMMMNDDTNQDNEDVKEKENETNQEAAAALSALDSGWQRKLPVTTANNIQYCGGCRKSLMRSKFLICVAGDEAKWHAECFRCNVCKECLEQEPSCFLYQHKILCKSDYLKLRALNAKNCAQCNWPISSSDWVRRAGAYVYHLACFTCNQCNRQLNTGEQFALNVAAVAGEATTNTNTTITNSITTTTTTANAAKVRLLCRIHFSESGGQPFADFSQQQQSSRGRRRGCTDSTPVVGGDCGPPTSASTTTFVSASAPTTAGSGRGAAPLASFELLRAQQQPQLAGWPQSPSSSAPPGELGGGLGGSGSSSTMLLPPKTKRVRTTFTEEQLAILQSNFKVDSNPDGQDLERIASVTGLSKRVTQVWFQNSRARQKKYLIKRRPCVGSHSNSGSGGSGGSAGSSSGAAFRCLEQLSAGGGDQQRMHQHKHHNNHLHHHNDRNNQLQQNNNQSPQFETSPNWSMTDSDVASALSGAYEEEDDDDCDDGDANQETEGREENDQEDCGGVEVACRDLQC